MNHKFRLYLDKNGDEELELLIPSDELKGAIADYVGDDFTPICDLCGKPADMFSFFPELGHKALCQDCAKLHKSTVQWYTEDLHPVFNSLITWMQNYDLSYTKRDYAEVDEFFKSKGHLSLHIENFMRNGD